MLKLFTEQKGISEWLLRWCRRWEKEPQSTHKRAQAMRQVNPAYIPRNHRIEQAIEAAVQREDFSLMEQLQQVLAHPFQEQKNFAKYALPPSPSERVTRTFCGT
jgi:uncharacterized protein YdiU (UPF0061 family)